MSENGYEAPAVEDTTTVEAPLNTTPVQSERQITPAWRRKDQDEG
jgi:hypothetical protein